MAARSKAWVCGPSLAELWVRIQSGAWLSVSCTRKCCVLPGRGLCDGRITRPEESYRVCVCVCVCVCVRHGLHGAALHATRQRVESPASERAETKLAFLLQVGMKRLGSQLVAL